MISSNITKLLAECTGTVEIVAASKTRSVEDILQAVDAGIVVFGENYIQEAEPKIVTIGARTKWHFIGKLQKNKVSKAVKLFDMIETIDSIELARKVDAESAKISKIMPILIEVNSGAEKQKNGILPRDIMAMTMQLMKFKNIKLMGLMTMGPYCDNVENVRPFYKITKKLYDDIAAKFPDNKNWRFLSMGMSDSYKIAIQEGANMVRIGTKIFGPR